MNSILYDDRFVCNSFFLLPNHCPLGLHLGKANNYILLWYDSAVSLTWVNQGGSTYSFLFFDDFFSIFLNFHNTVSLLDIMFIFDRCFCS